MSMPSVHVRHPVSLSHSIPHPFTVYSWNACSLLARAPSVQLFLLHQHPSILIIIEPMITSQDQIPKVPNYQAVHIPHHSQHSHGGLVIYFHTSITHQLHTAPTPTFTHYTATSTCIFHVASPILPRPFLLVPIYISCHATASDWNDIVDFFSTVPSIFTPGRDMPTLIIGDMNARDPMWDSNYTTQQLFWYSTQLFPLSRQRLAFVKLHDAQH